MHYCQSCPDLTPMEPAQASAVCPGCGRRDPAPTEPLLVVTGASGAGKTTLFSPLARELAGEAAVFDIDWLIDAFGMQAEGAALNWGAIRSAWLSVAEGLASGGLPTVLLGPLAPFHLEQLPKAGWIASMHFFLLDCSDVVRRERLEARPPWRGRDRERAIAEQAQWGVWLREHIGQGVDTSQAAVEETVGSVAGWVRSVISTPVRWRDDATLAAAVEAAALSDRRLDSRLPQRRGPERAHGPRAAAPAAMVDRAGRSARGGAQPDCGARAWHAVPPSSRGLGAPVGGYRAEPEARLGCPSRHR
jgi:hypothetical protein